MSPRSELRPSGPRVRRPPVRLALLLVVLALALLLRLNGIGLGLPGLYDPDEPLFLINGLQLLRDATLQPGWFGHPGTTTVYMLALTDIAVFFTGLAGGAWSGPAAFAAHLYTDPSLAVLPARLLIALMAVAVVAATARLGRVLGDAQAGLVAALLLAVSPLHVELSQLVRTDIMVSLATVMAMLAAVRIADAGKRRNIIVGGLWMGAAVATKWPGAAFALAPLGAIWLHHGNDRRAVLRHGALFVVVMTLMMLVLMPPLWLQPTAVWTALVGEAQPAHVGAAGTGFLGNLVWYVDQALARALGWGGVALAAAGLALVAWRRDRRTFVVMVLPSLVLLLVFAGQANVWQRWLVPVLPAVALLAGIGMMTIVRRLLPAQAAPAGIVAAMLLALPLAITAWGEGRARGNPTEARAVAWALANIPPSASITTEMLAFPLLGGGWEIRFPLGTLGCPDGRALLAGKVNFNDANRAQAGRQKIVLGTVAADRLADCWADYVIVHDQDRWIAERGRYPREAGVYENLLAQGRIVGEFRAEPGRSSGPRTLVVRLDQRNTQQIHNE